MIKKVDYTELNTILSKVTYNGLSLCVSGGLKKTDFPINN